MQQKSQAPLLAPYGSLAFLPMVSKVGGGKTPPPAPQPPIVQQDQPVAREVVRRRA